MSELLSNRAVGIDALAVHVPRLYVDLCDEWARVRAPELGEPSVEHLVGKVQKGVGVTEMAVPDAHEDSATLAAMASVKAIVHAGIDPRDIGTIAIGTETTVDQSKSIAAYVLGMIERHFGVELRRVGAPQFQFACIGATYALESAVNAFRAGEATKPYSLVVATDVSKYPLRTAGEYTQGAGAVAMLVSENPRLLALDPRVAGTITRDERDFFRPNGLSTAIVDGKYSIDVYLGAMAEATEMYLERARRELGKPGARIDELAEHLLFHVPFPRMSEYAALRVLGDAWRRAPSLRDALIEAAPLLFDQALESDPKVRKDAEKQLSQSVLFRETSARAIEPSLVLSRRIGNIYSGSMYLALASLLETSPDRAKLAGSRAAFFSYGSGASARVFSGVFVDPERAYVPHVIDALEGGARVSLDLATYERLHAGPSQEGLASLAQPAESVISPQDEFALTRVGTESGPKRTDLGYRYYDWVATQPRDRGTRGTTSSL
ncbi:MAG: hydroxymethylglutaryl-CoA synthase family protein [Polyangiaceae bacterium]|nr:hydroxymethylglutaryl-CoA synthase family protein [Polyangiaceae bacterium]